MLAENSSKIETLKQILIFKGLAEDDLNVISELLNTEFLRRGEIIYSQNSPGENVYIIRSGGVQLSRIEKGEGESILTTYHSGDMFGQNELYLHQPRYGTATTMTEAELYFLSTEDFEWLIVNYPIVRTYLKASILPYKTHRKLKLSWLNNDESLNYVAQRHPLSMLVKILGIAFVVSLTLTILVALITYLDDIRLVTTLSAGAAGLTTLVGLALGLLAYIDWRNDYFYVTDIRVVWREMSILRRSSRQEIPLRTIQSLSVKTPHTIARMIQVGDLIIRTFNSEMTLENVNRPALMKTIIDGLLDKARRRSFQSEQTAIRQTIRSQLGYEEDSPESEVPDVYPVEQAESDQRMTLFTTRIVEEGKITYRKHWWVFFKKAWKSTAGFIGTILISVFFSTTVLNILGTVGLVGLYTSPLLMILWWIYQYEDWRNDIYRVTMDRIIDRDKKPFGKESFRSAPIHNIQSVGHEIPNTIGLFLNVGNVEIHVGEETLTFNGVHDPAQVHQDISRAMEQLAVNSERRMSKQEHERMATWLEIYHEETKGKSNTNSPE